MTECVECGRSVEYGSGLYVDRVAYFTEDYEGWLCRECVACDEPDTCFHEECMEVRNG